MVVVGWEQRGRKQVVGCNSCPFSLSRRGHGISLLLMTPKDSLMISGSQFSVCLCPPRILSAHCIWESAISSLWGSGRAAHLQAKASSSPGRCTTVFQVEKTEQQFPKGGFREEERLERLFLEPGELLQRRHAIQPGRALHLGLLQLVIGYRIFLSRYVGIT